MAVLHTEHKGVLVSASFSNKRWRYRALIWSHCPIGVFHAIKKEKWIVSIELTLDGWLVLSPSPMSSALSSGSINRSGYVSDVSLEGTVGPLSLGMLLCGSDAFEDVPLFAACPRGIFSDVQVAPLPRGVGAVISAALFSGYVKWVFRGILECKPIMYCIRWEIMKCLYSHREQPHCK
jgi:hypothetical protein